MAGQEKPNANWIRKVYLYLTMLITLIMVIGGSVGAVMALADMIAPAHYYMSFEDYRQMQLVHHQEQMDNGKQMAEADEADLRRKYDELVRMERERAIQQAKNSLVKSLAWVLVPLPVFLYFQRLVRRDR